MTEQTQSTMSIILADKIRHRIIDEQLPAGHVLMTEGQLAEEYQVSRTIVREAVSRLRALGILDGKQRRGLVVQSPDFIQLLSDSIPHLAASQTDERELKMLRYVIELGAIELAVKNATAAQMDRLDAIVTQMEKSIEAQQWEAGVELDLAFHSLVLEMTNSKYVAGMQQVLSHFFQTISEIDRSEPGQKKRIIWEHTELAAAIRNRDLEHARVMIRMQFQGFV
tara:strand:- start:13334 stop:14005 length:672 start_codon:yes stop_codon:yes gene_type:complete